MNRLCNEGGWLLNGFAGSNGLTELAAFNGVNCVFVELDQEQLTYGVERIEGLQRRLDALTKEFEFDVGLMLIHAGDEELAFEDARWLLPYFALDTKPPELSKLPWFDLQMCTGEHKNVHSRAMACYKNTTHLRVSKLLNFHISVFHLFNVSEFLYISFFRTLLGYISGGSRPCRISKLGSLGIRRP